ncbi:MAG: ATP-binding protein [Mangrovibacterium sp.]
MVTRDLYLRQIEPLIGKPLIKIITGIRRSGKSTVMQLLQDLLIKRGVLESCILYINLESFQYSQLTDSRKLYEFINTKLSPDKKYYLLMDEIQVVEKWEQAVNSLQVDFDVDIYLTGSNSRLLSSELATYLAGRYVELPIYTLSFREYLDFKKTYAPNTLKTNYRDDISDFIRMGGFPVIHTATYSTDTAYKIIYDIYSSVILRDTVQRYNIRDVELLERVVKYVFDNIGNSFSARNVSDYFKNQQRKIDLNTIYNYLNALEGAFIIYRLPRYNVKGKELLKTQEKYFLGDPSLLYAVMGYRDRQISGILENIMMLELKRRGFTIYVGKLQDKEVDFIAEKAGQKLYVQVAYKLASEEIVKREFTPLLQIEDHYPKYVVSMDDFWQDSIEGVKHKHLADFLLQETF